MLEPDCISWYILWPHLNTETPFRNVSGSQGPALNIFFLIYTKFILKMHTEPNGKICLCMQYLYILWGDVYDLSPLLPALISQPRRFVCVWLDSELNAREGVLQITPLWVNTANEARLFAARSNHKQQFHIWILTLTHRQKASRRGNENIEFCRERGGKKNKNKASLTMLWVVEKTSKWIFTPVASSSRGSPGHVLNPPSWEGVCFISAEIPAKAPQVRDTGCGYSAHGWFISTH